MEQSTKKKKIQKNISGHQNILLKVYYKEKNNFNAKKPPSKHTYNNIPFYFVFCKYKVANTFELK